MVHNDNGDIDIVVDANCYLAMPWVDVDCLSLVVGRVTSKDLTPGHYLGHCENLIDRIGDNDASVVVGG